MFVSMFSPDSAFTNDLGFILSGCGKKPLHISESYEAGVQSSGDFDYDLFIVHDCEQANSDISAKEVVRRLRERKIRQPICVLLDKDCPLSRAAVLNMGADICFSSQENKFVVMAAMRRLMLRGYGHAMNQIQAQNLTLDVDSKSVHVNNEGVERKVDLTRTEYDLLELLLIRKNNTVMDDSILDHIYGGEDESDAKIIDVYACKLRKKLSTAGYDTSSIVRVRELGLCLEDVSLACEFNPACTESGCALVRAPIIKNSGPVLAQPHLRATG